MSDFCSHRSHPNRPGGGCLVCDDEPAAPSDGLKQTMKALEDTFVHGTGILAVGADGSLKASPYADTVKPAPVAEVGEWKPLYGYWDTHEVSSAGQVRSWVMATKAGRRRRKNPRMLAVWINAYGYPSVNILGKSKTIHRLVLESFIGPAPIGTEGAHNNGIKTDCRIGNLRWATKTNNANDKQLHAQIASLTKERDELRLAKPNAGSTDTLTEKYRLREQVTRLEAESIESDAVRIAHIEKIQRLERELAETNEELDLAYNAHHNYVIEVNYELKKTIIAARAKLETQTHNMSIMNAEWVRYKAALEQIAEQDDHDLDAPIARAALKETK